MKIGIAGAGIMGRLLAFKLVQQGHDITLFDAGEKNTCSMTAAGLLTPIAELAKNEPIIFTLGKIALEKHWPEILSQLPNPVYFQNNGSLVLAHPQDRQELKFFIQTIQSKLTNPLDCELLNREHIETLEPELTRFSEGYYFQAEGQLDNQAVLDALHSYLISKHIHWIEPALVTDIHPNAVIASTVFVRGNPVNTQTYMFDWVIDCRGLGTSNLFKDLRSVRGELVWLHAPEVNLTRPIRFLHPRYNLYIAPRPDHVYILGASEIESHDTSPISVRTLLELLTAAYCVHPGFAEARVIHTATHCRPTLEDHLPRIQYSDGFMAVNGLYRHGFLIAPTLAEEIGKYLENRMECVEYPTLFHRSH